MRVSFRLSGPPSGLPEVRVSMRSPFDQTFSDSLTSPELPGSRSRGAAGQELCAAERSKPGASTGVPEPPTAPDRESCRGTSHSLTCNRTCRIIKPRGRKAANVATYGGSAGVRPCASGLPSSEGTMRNNPRNPNPR